VARDDRTRVALVEANHRYEQRFDRVFLICATGLTADQILAAAGTRLQNDDATECVVVADELRRIVLLRLRKVIDE
jgi:2-oxo-4-hydroxy-4-carboxy-5-ureidoimidazoline decarboxylase